MAGTDQVARRTRGVRGRTTRAFVRRSSVAPRAAPATFWPALLALWGVSAFAPRSNMLRRAEICLPTRGRGVVLGLRDAALGCG